MSAKYGKEIVANYSLLQLSFTLISQENCWDIQHTCKVVILIVDRTKMENRNWI